MHRTFIFLSLFAATTSLAQNAAINISCGECNAFQTLQVVLDGQDMGANQPMRIVDIAPGQHEVKVIKWKSPFATEVLYTGMVDFPRGTELRAKASKGKLEIYGKGDYAPPAPVATGPTQEQIDSARAWVDEAKDSLDELQERVEDADDDCSKKVLGRLGSLEDAIGDALRSTNRDSLSYAVSKAQDAQRLITQKCERRSTKKWSKNMDRVVAKLQSASRSL